MSQDLSGWTARERPKREAIEGRYVRLEPLEAATHGDGLFAASTVADADRLFRWLPDYPPENRAAFQPWLDKAQASADPMFFTVVDKASGRVAGRQTLMRVDTANGVIEIGNVYWSPLMARMPAATEALYLFARHVFEDLGYRRFEWKCHNDNLPSKRAALRFGFAFEGIFRQHMIVKGKNRDTAWFAMLDRDWPLEREAYERWLAPRNFDSEGRQIERLDAIRQTLKQDR